MGDHCKYAKILRPNETLGLKLNPFGELFIPESDNNRLIMRSNMPDTGVFQDWVCEEVIPTLRKTGRYQIGPPEAQAPATIDNRQLALLIESMNKRDDHLRDCWWPRRLNAEVSESKDLIRLCSRATRSAGRSERTEEPWKDLISINSSCSVPLSEDLQSIVYNHKCFRVDIKDQFLHLRQFS